ncbi:MAG: DNA primase, partial [Planctomycetota bacterium]
HRPPASGKLRSDEFKEAARLLQEIAGKVDGVLSGQPTPAVASAAPTATAISEPKNSEPVRRNIPLKESENERARSLVTLHEELVVDVAEMSPPAAAYFRSRPFLTPDVCRKWRMGYLPHSASSLLRGRVVYAYSNEQDDILSYFGRDPQFEQHWLEWEQAGRPDDKRPMKHRFVKDFHRGLELYGQNGAARLKEPHVRESLERIGLVVAEGPNDIIQLDALGVAAVGLCSNKSTDEQVEKIARFARRLAAGRVILMPDNDTEGEEGFKELLWRLSQCEGVTARLGWSSAVFGGAFAGRQPESLSLEEWNVIRTRIGE